MVGGVLRRASIRPYPRPHVTTPVGGLCIAHLIETNGPGGAERMLVHMVQELQDSGCRNIVITPAGGEQWLEQQITQNRVTVQPFVPCKPVSLKIGHSFPSLF